MKQKLNGLQSVMCHRESSFLSFSFFFSVGLPKEWAQPIRGEVDWTGRHQNCSRLSLAERTYKSYRAVWRRLKWEPPRNAFVMFVMFISDVHLEMNYPLVILWKPPRKNPKMVLNFINRTLTVERAVYSTLLCLLLVSFEWRWSRA